jgi:hypothetical protein
MQEKRAHHKIKAAVGERKCESVAGHFGRICLLKVKAHAVQRSDLRIAISLHDALAYVSGCSPHIQNREYIRRFYELPEQVKHGTMTAEQTVYAGDVTQVLFRGCGLRRFKVFRAQHATRGTG